MPDATLFKGQAGTGKTHELIKTAADRANQLELDDHRRVLFVTRMHGARRRLSATLAQLGFERPYSLMTLDSLALRLVNKWRRTLGLALPVLPTGADKEFKVGEFEVEGGFDQLVAAACKLMKMPSVSGIVGATYPLIVIDEFQDCTAGRLELVRSLAEQSEVLAASDEFQALEAGCEGCPGEEWMRSLEDSCNVVELETVHRTTNPGVLQVARGLRQGAQAPEADLAVFACPGSSGGLAAWRILHRLVLCSPERRWTGSTALISPSRDPIIEKILGSCDRQLAKRGLSPLRWRRELPAADEEAEVLSAIRVQTQGNGRGLAGKVLISESAKGLASEAIRRAQRISKLRGLSEARLPDIEREALALLHAKRAYSRSEPRRVVVTVHGAKNREFDNVFVIWPYRVPPDMDLQRRLLYNAITRCKLNCEVLIIGKMARAAADPVLSLIPAPQPAVPKKGKEG